MVFTVSTRNYIGEDCTISAYEDGQEIPAVFITLSDKSRKDEAIIFAAQISGMLNGQDAFNMKSDSRVFFERHPNGFSLRHQKNGASISSPTLNIRVNAGMPEDLEAYIREKIVPDHNGGMASKLCRAVTFAAPQAPVPQSAMRP